MNKVIATRQNFLFALLPIVICLAFIIPFGIFRTDIENVIPSFLYWMLTVIAIIVFLSWLYFIWYFFDFFHVIAMPKNLVTLKSQSIVLEKAIKIKNANSLSSISTALDSEAKVNWLNGDEVSGSDIWEEDWAGKTKIELANVKAFAFLSVTKNLQKRLESGKPIRGTFIVVTNDNDTFAQPQIADLKYLSEQLELQ
ncbi:MAG: hypothetical protein FWE01_00600 [Firmicutes bacterium]|nr:hypothetical protein [Bacillota bacterium]